MGNAVQEKLITRVRELRKEKGLSQAELANEIGKDQQSIQRLEAGKVNPSFQYLTEIIEGLEVTVSEFFSEGFD